MRILLISGSFPPMKCGVGDYTALLAGSLAASGGITVGVLTGADTGKPAIPGVEMLPPVTGWRLGSLTELLRAVRSWQPDIVHLQYPAKGYGRAKMPLLLPLLLGRAGYGVVQTWHEPLGFLRRLRYLLPALTRDALVVVEPDYSDLVPGWFRRLIEKKRIYRFIPVGANIPVACLDDSERERRRRELAPDGSNIVAYFGFVAPPKGLESLFRIADPTVDRLVLICDLDPADPYQRSILALADREPWRGRVVVTGYLAAPEVAELLAVADAAVFPFVTGATSRNASVLAARAQGTFVLTTSRRAGGFRPTEHSYYAVPGDLTEMRTALRRYCGSRSGSPANIAWDGIAASHRQLYLDLLAINAQEG